MVMAAVMVWMSDGGWWMQRGPYFLLTDNSKFVLMLMEGGCCRCGGDCEGEGVAEALMWLVVMGFQCVVVRVVNGQ